MIETFLAQSDWQDLLHYLVIFAVIFGLSPYGVFLLRRAVAARTGAPRPTLHRRSRTSPEAQIRDFADNAVSRIEALSGEIRDLEEALLAATAETDRLAAENEALRDHIRSRESAGDTRWGDEPPPDTDEADGQPGAVDADLAVLGLDAGATRTEIRRAYRQAVMRHHPDRGGDPEMLRRVNDAYARLKGRFG